MPQVRCPNCGTTINLETRKETDFNLIINALHKNPKTFTQLLNYTRLPRKTLSLRLKELCDRGVIIKDGGYHLSESYPIKKLWGEKVSTLYMDVKNSLLNTRKGALLILILLCVGFPVAVKAYQMLKHQISRTIFTTTGATIHWNSKFCNKHIWCRRPSCMGSLHTL
jgi:hypothetical protein